MSKSSCDDPAHGDRKSQLLEHRHAFLPAPRASSKRPRVRAARPARRGRPPRPASTRSARERRGSAPAPREPGSGPYQPLTRSQFRICASSRPLRARRAQARPRANASSPDFPCQKLGEPDQKPRTGQPEIVAVPLEDGNRLPDELARWRVCPARSATARRRRDPHARATRPSRRLRRCASSTTCEGSTGLASARPARPARSASSTRTSRCAGSSFGIRPDARPSSLTAAAASPRPSARSPAARR